jgi:hypothetical protein
MNKKNYGIKSTDEYYTMILKVCSVIDCQNEIIENLEARIKELEGGKSGQSKTITKTS